MEKERILLTDITLHTRDYRPTSLFSKIVERGRMYFSMKTKDPQKGTVESAIKDLDEKNHTFKLKIQLPPDLQERINRGEVELVMPKDGLLVFAGKDTMETVAAMKKKEERQTIHHKWWKKWWRDGKEGV